MELMPKTLASGITQIDSALFKPIYSKPASEVYYAYIKDAVGVVSKAYIEAYDVAVPLFDVGPAKGISIDFDMQLLRTQYDTYEYRTLPDPHVLWIDTNNTLWYSASKTAPRIQLAINVSQCCLVRGWKNVNTASEDQGFVACYIVNRRAYRISIGHGALHEPVEFAEVPERVDHISAYRTLDYRIIFTLNGETNTYLIETERCWAGVAIPEETVDNFRIESSAGWDYAEIGKFLYNCPAEVVASWKIQSPTSEFTTSLDIFTGQCIDAHNVDGFGVYLYLDETVYTTLTKDEINEAIYITDGRQIRFAIASYSYVGRYLLLKTANFNNAKGHLKVHVRGRLLKNLAGKLVSERAVSFTPIGLVPYPTNPPKIVSITIPTEKESFEDYIVAEFDVPLSGEVTKVWMDTKLRFMKYVTTNTQEQEEKLISAVSSESYLGDRNKLLIRFNHNDGLRGEVSKIIFEYTMLNSLIWGATELDVLESVQYEYANGILPYYNNIGSYETLTSWKLVSSANYNYAQVQRSAYTTTPEVVEIVNILSQGGYTFEQVKPIEP